jgi:hypothetical protein
LVGRWRHRNSIRFVVDIGDDTDRENAADALKPSAEHRLTILRLRGSRLTAERPDIARASWRRQLSPGDYPVLDGRAPEVG